MNIEPEHLKKFLLDADLITENEFDNALKLSQESDTNVGDVLVSEGLIDQEKLKSALFNIVDNAVKYTPKGGVDITVEREERSIKIIVSDTGIGIRPDKEQTL